MSVFANLLCRLIAQAPLPARIAEREVFYERCFGESPEIYHSTDRVYPHVDIYHFKPTDARPFHILMTGGMSEYLQPADGPGTPARLELLIQVKMNQPWAANLLKLIAEYPAQNDTSFDTFHTVPIGARLTETSQISAFLLVPAEMTELVGQPLAVDGEAVTFFQCIPITMSEHAFARDVGSQELYQKLKEADLLVHADDERHSIAE